MKKSFEAKVKLNTEVGKVEDGEVVVGITTDDASFEEAEKAYTAATDYRTGLVGSITNSIASIAVDQFKNEEVDVVTGTMNFGPTVLGATVHRSYTVGEDTLNSHVVVTSSDDYTKTVSDAIAGIFDGEEA